MRLLANENFPARAVAALRDAGHDVVWIRTDAPGSVDEVILQRAQTEDRILLTFDKDFGELAFRHALPASSGVILFRISPYSPEHVALMAVTVLSIRDDYAGHFSVIENDRVRMTPLPQI